MKLPDRGGMPGRGTWALVGADLRVRPFGNATKRADTEVRPYKVLPLAVAMILGIAGCQEYGGTRPEIRGNGQGGVEVQRVHNPTPPAPPPCAASSQFASQQTAMDDLQSRLRQQQAEIESLQATLRARDEEIFRLKRPPMTQPTTGQ